MKNADIKKGIYAIICIAAKNHGQAFSKALLHEDLSQGMLSEHFPHRRPDDDHAEFTIC